MIFLNILVIKTSKFSGFRKGVRGRTLFPPEKGFPRVTCRCEIARRRLDKQVLDKDENDGYNNGNNDNFTDPFTGR